MAKNPIAGSSEKSRLPTDDVAIIVGACTDLAQTFCVQPGQLTPATCPTLLSVGDDLVRIGALHIVAEFPSHGLETSGARRHPRR